MKTTYSNLRLTGHNRSTIGLGCASRQSLVLLASLLNAVSLAAAPPQSAPLKLTYSNYIGGRTGGFTMIRDVVTDTQGNNFVTGGTASTDLPTTAGAFQTKLKGAVD